MTESAKTRGVVSSKRSRSPIDVEAQKALDALVSSSMITTRSVRANRGTLLKEIIQQGFDSSEEEVLKEASSDDDEWSSSSFECSSNGSSGMGTPSDFSEKEDEGMLSDGVSASEEERQVRVAEKKLQAAGADTWKRKGSAQPLEHTITLVRQAPKIPQQEKLEAALKRASDALRREAEGDPVAASEDAGKKLSLLLQHGASASHRRRRKGPQREFAADPVAGGGQLAERIGSEDQSVMWSSSSELLNKYHCGVVMSFGHHLPAMFVQ